MPADVSTPPLNDLTFSLVGPGRVGSSLSRWLIDSGAQLGEVASRRPGVEILDRRTIDAESLTTRGQSLLLIAVPDDQLLDVAERLSGRPQARVILHTSGARGAEALTSLVAVDQEVGSIHPLRPFPAVIPHLAEATSTFFAIDGSAGAIALCQRLVAAWKARSAVVPGPTRPLYHFAAALAAGGTATLFNLSLDLAREAGLPKQAAAAYRDLAREAQSAVAEAGPVAITGPVARGEVSVLVRLAEVRTLEPQLYPLLVLLALETLRQVDGGPEASPARRELRKQLESLCRQPYFLDAVLDP